MILKISKIQQISSVNYLFSSTNIVLPLCRSIMRDVKRDNRVLSLVNKSGLRNQLTTMLDQLQRCQKSLNEFLEVRYLYIVKPVLLWSWMVLVKNKICDTYKLAFKALHHKMERKLSIHSEIFVWCQKSCNKFLEVGFKIHTFYHWSWA